METRIWDFKRIIKRKRIVVLDRSRNEAYIVVVLNSRLGGFWNPDKENINV